MSTITLSAYGTALKEALTKQTYGEVKHLVDKAVLNGIRGGLYQILGFPAPTGIPVVSGAMKGSMFHDVAEQFGVDIDIDPRDEDDFASAWAGRKRSKYMSKSHQVRILIHRGPVGGQQFVKAIKLVFPENYLDTRDRHDFGIGPKTQRITPYNLHEQFVESFKLGFRRAFTGPIRIGSNLNRYYGDPLEDAEDY